jgi:hypothetical protein
VNNVKKDLVEIGWGRVNWNGLIQDGDSWGALVNAVMNLRIPRNFGIFSRVYTSGDP